MSKEPFVYLWYIASTKRYYLGVAIGKPYYTHSSTIKELCDIVPHSKNSSLEERKEFWDKYERGEIEGVRYRILPKRFILNVPYLTEDLHDYGKMCEREHVLLKNRFERCWNRYYNKSLGHPRYIDTSGENNPMYGRTGQTNPNYKHGKCVGGEENKKIRTAHRSELQKTPKNKEYLKKYNQTPKRKAYMKAYDQTPERKAYNLQRRSTPEHKENDKLRKRARRAKKKAEAQS